MNRNSPPPMNPAAATTHGVKPISAARSRPGLISDQKLAAIMTPAAKPSIVSKTFLLMVLKKNTREAPSAVTPHVKSVANSACVVGSNRSKNSIIPSPTSPYFSFPRNSHQNQHCDRRYPRHHLPAMHPPVSGIFRTFRDPDSTSHSESSSLRLPESQFLLLER